MVKMATCDVNVIQNALGIQQIGPRTVIVPADPIIWDDSTSYEYLTLVASTDFGQSYISKRDVPAGTPLTNTDYWIPGPLFNAQLAQIMRELNEKADASDVSAIQTTVNELTHERYLVVIGDSFSVDDGTSNSSEGPLWYEYVADQYKLTPKAYAVNGTGFITGDTNNFSGQLAKARAALDADYVDMVCVLGGWNDLRTGNVGTPLIMAVRQLCNDIASAFPNARVIVAGCNTFQNGMLNGASSTFTVSKLIENGARSSSGAAFVDVHMLNIMQPAYFGAHGGTHPNAYGEKALASAFTSLMAPQSITVTEFSNEVEITGGTINNAVLELGNNNVATIYLGFNSTSGGNVEVTLPRGFDISASSCILANTSGNVVYGLVTNTSTGQKITFYNTTAEANYGGTFTTLL